MARLRPERPSILRRLGLAAVCALVAIGAGWAQSSSDLENTKHNLSVSGPGTVRALTETRICIFCHTPHNAAPLSPLWNKELEPQVYTLYTSPTLKAGPLPQPSGPTKLCLSCHDGTIAMGSVLNPPGGIPVAGGGALPAGSLATLGLDLSGHHPVSFPYHSALPNAELASSPAPDLVVGGSDEVHCITCHDPHKDTYGKFLLKDNRYSALCTTCHQMAGWTASAHATSTASVVGILPRPPKTWPAWTQLNEWGCETCHTPHFAPTAEHLLNFTDALPEPFACTAAGCHSSDPPPIHPGGGGGAPSPGGIGVPGARALDIARQVRKASAHHEASMEISRARLAAGGPARGGLREVACADCHNPHLVTTRRAEAPYASGLLQAVPGVDRNGAERSAATYEYEVCFKCHADNTPDLDYVPRVVSDTNARRAFDTINPSYHPVLGVGKALSVPSLPSSFEPSLTSTSIIYCTTCHADDEGGSRGPHGSSYPPILVRRYEMQDGTPESFDNYALCYRCHDRNSILGDASFRTKTLRTTASGGGHSGHLHAGAPCSACHDPHGVIESGAGGPSGTGAHTHLINFDTRIVQPAAGRRFPVFEDKGGFSGTCTLVCHGFVHDAASYP